MHMGEPPAVTSGLAGQESAAERSDSNVAPASDTTSGDAAARMKQVIDRFIWQDGGRETEPGANAFPPALAGGVAAGYVTTDIVARLAPRRLDASDRLPRIVTSSHPVRPPALPGDDRSPIAFNARTAPAPNRRYQPGHEHKHQRLGMDTELSPLAARWRTARRVLAVAAATTCVCSTGVLWATHRSDMVAETSGHPAEIAAAIPEPAAVGWAAPGQSIRNTPVLIREGASLTFPATEAVGWRQEPSPAVPPAESVSAPAPILPRIINDGASAPPLPITPVVRVVPVVPIVPVAPVISVAPLPEAAIAPGAAKADAAPPSAPPLDRNGLTEIAARPAETFDHALPSTAAAAAKRSKSTVGRRPRHREHAARSAQAARGSDASAQSRGAAPKVARGYVPPAGWEMRRQGLRTEPEPEPSMFKKLIGYVWPPGKAWTTAQPPKPAAPVAPAVTTKPYSWSDSSRARP
jgi:hypothetical protein